MQDLVRASKEKMVSISLDTWFSVIARQDHPNNLIFTILVPEMGYQYTNFKMPDRTEKVQH